MGLSVAAGPSSEPPLCGLEWPLGVRLGTCRRVAVPQALRSLCRGSHTRPHSPDPQCSPSLRPRAGPTLECGSR